MTTAPLPGDVRAMLAQPNPADMDRLARHYTGDPYPVRGRPRVSAWVEVHSWHGWGAQARS